MQLGAKILFSSGLGAIIRDSEGRMVGASSRSLKVDLQGPIAELMAILQGIRLAVSIDCEKLLIESNCMVAINLISKKSNCLGEVEVVLEDIWTSTYSFSDISFSHIPRDCNRVADKLAKVARTRNLNMTRMCNFPRWMYDRVSFDHV